MLVELYSGLRRITSVLRGTLGGAAVVADAGPCYLEPTSRLEVFHLTLPATTGGVAAGQILGAAAAASTQFGLINPLSSGKNLAIIKFGMGVISGTPGAGPLFHGFITGINTLTATPIGTIRSNMAGLAGNSVALPWASAAGAALSGSTVAPLPLRIADFASTATAQATGSGHVRTIELVDGDIIIPPGVMWLPLWSAAGTAFLCGYSVEWMEFDV